MTVYKGREESGLKNRMKVRQGFPGPGSSVVCMSCPTRELASSASPTIFKFFWLIPYFQGTTYLVFPLLFLT